MSLLGAFNIGVGAIGAFSEALGAVSQNISNMRTPGYRQADTEFTTLLGGIDVKDKDPGGVRAMTRRLIGLQGPVETTGGAFDTAIQGQGFFVFAADPTGTSNDFVFSRAGNLTPILAPGSQSTSYLGNSNGQYLMGWQAVNGAIDQGDFSTLRPIPARDDQPFPGLATTTGTLTATIPAAGTTAAAQIFYIDANGLQQTVNLNWTKTAANAWNLQASDVNGTAIGAPISMTFDGNGVLTSSSTVNIGGVFDLDVANVAQLGSSTLVADYQQDGIERGEFVRYKINDDGTVYGFYTSGAIRPLFRIPVAVFANPNGLAEEAGNVYHVTDTSGPAQLQAADGSGLRIAPGAIELANFDLSDGFSRLIVTQRAYNTAAQVVRTVDEMSEVVRDLKR